MNPNISPRNQPLLLLLKRMVWALFILSLARLVFWGYNHSPFPWPGWTAAGNLLLFGAYFDLISLFYCLSPLILLHLIPGNWFFQAKLQRGMRIFYSAILFLIVTLTFIDAGYFPFSKARLGVELFHMAGSEEISIWTYVLDYWWFIPLILGLTYLAWRGFPGLPAGRRRPAWYLEFPLNLLFLTLLVFTIRGGWRLKPLRSIDTALFVTPGYSLLAISTAFNFLESFQAETIQVPSYWKPAELAKIQERDYHLISQPAGKARKNIVILILESFGKEYTFPETGEASSQTPFLRELAKYGTLYNRAYSNGTRSVDAIPAILEGVPKLTKTDFMYSNYIQNITPGFPYYLKKEGYHCAFFHGGKNGTLGFEAFLKSRGWEYYGKDQYSGSEEDFDGQWGIYDGPYLQYVAGQIKNLPSPFVTSIFTLSSHHPYQLPADFQDSFRNIRQPILQTIRYTDHCLRDFFETIQKEAWFNQTVFILTGDHSSENFTRRYQSRAAKFEVPILVFEPGKTVPTVNEEIVQHIDILPLALERAGYSGRVFTLGTYFENPENKAAFQNEEGSYQLIGVPGEILFDGSRVQAVRGPLSADAKKKLEEQLKSKIQDFNHRLIHNQLH